MISFFPSIAHSPDNLFLGFVVDKAVTWSTNSFNPATEKDRPIGLLYAKQAGYLNVSTLGDCLFSFSLRSFENLSSYSKNALPIPSSVVSRQMHLSFHCTSRI